MKLVELDCGQLMVSGHSVLTSLISVCRLFSLSFISWVAELIDIRRQSTHRNQSITVCSLHH